MEINTTILNIIILAQLHELIPVCQYARIYLRLQNYTWIIIFTMEFYYMRPSKHIFMILAIDSRNFRYLQEGFYEIK